MATGEGQDGGAEKAFGGLFYPPTSLVLFRLFPTISPASLYYPRISP